MNRTKTSTRYKVTYEVFVPEEMLDGASAITANIEDCAQHIMESTYVKPEIEKIEGSLVEAIISPYITSAVTDRGPAYFENLPADVFEELLQNDLFDRTAMFGNYDTCEELIEFIHDNPMFSVGGLFYKNGTIRFTEITGNTSSVDDKTMIEFLKFARKADELNAGPGDIRAWWD